MNTKKPAFPEDPILLVDDEPSWLHSLAFTLEYTGNYQNLVICNDSRELIGMLRCRRVGLVLLDLVMPHIGGEDLLVQVVREFPDVPVIVLSGLNQLETAVRCMKLGAFDYYVKTTEPDRLLGGIQRALEIRALQRENRELSTRLLRRELQHPEQFAAFTTRSPKLEAVFHYLEAIAGSTEPLLITGEPGSGKELAARALHALACPHGTWGRVAGSDLDERNFSPRLYGEAQQPGLIDRTRGGILYIEGIDSLPPASQAKLMQLLQKGEYAPGGDTVSRRLETRLVCSTGRDLAEMVGECRFRNDLFYRLSMHHVRMPPLRERLEDLPLLLDRFVSEASAELKRRRPSMPRNLAPLLASYPFPGNVCELRDLIAAAVAESPVGRLSMEPFRRYITRPGAAPIDAAQEGTPLLIVPGRLPTLGEARDLVIQEALHRANGNQSIAARLLGISQPALSIHLKKAAPSSRS
jgi:DNA-binding NtrC family response regulator